MKKLLLLLFASVVFITYSYSQVTLTLQPDSADGKDAMLHELPSQVNTNWETEQQLPASAWTHGGTFANIRSIIEFDLSSIPNGAVVNSAYLSLYAIDFTYGQGYHSTMGGPNNAWLERIINPWNESTVTWNNQPATTTQNRVSLPASTSQTQDYTNIDVTTLIQDIVSNPNAGYGIMLKLQDETTNYRRLNFCSSDHTNPLKRPKLVVTYTPTSPTNDTCVTLQPHGEKGKDAMLHQLPTLADTNWATETQLPASAWTHNSTEAIIRSVVDFDISFIPANSVITNALLSLYAIDNTYGQGYHSTLSGPNDGWLERITTAWDESTVTWNNQPATTTQNRVALPASTSPTQNYTDIDITALMQDIHNNPTSGYGIMLKLQNETTFRRLNFCSSDHSNPSLRPKLYICYTIPNISIKDVAPINNFNVYPNPAGDVLNFEYSGAGAEGMQIIVLNVLGQEVMQVTSPSLINTLDISHLKHGLYFYNGLFNNTRFSGKFIKE